MLYKYRNCMDGQERSKRVEGILRDGDMFFAVPSEFEDIHDCEINVKLDASDAKIKKFLSEIENSPDFQGLENKIENEGWNENPQKFATLFNRYPGRKTDILGICCLCKNPNKVEMWEKYACNEGICIGYKTRSIYNSPTAIELKERINCGKFETPYLPFMEVTYKDTGHPAINRLPEVQFLKEIVEVVLTKDNKWSFEEECRGIILKEFIGEDINPPGKLMHCSDDAIGEVIFSPWSSTEMIEWVIRLIAGRPCGINGVEFLRFDGNEISMLHY